MRSQTISRAYRRSTSIVVRVTYHLTHSFIHFRIRRQCGRRRRLSWRLGRERLLLCPLAHQRSLFRRIPPPSTPAGTNHSIYAISIHEEGRGRSCGREEVPFRLCAGVPAYDTLRHPPFALLHRPQSRKRRRDSRERGRELSLPRFALLLRSSKCRSFGPLRLVWVFHVDFLFAFSRLYSFHVGVL